LAGYEYRRKIWVNLSLKKLNLSRNPNDDADWGSLWKYYESLEIWELYN